MSTLPGFEKFRAATFTKSFDNYNVGAPVDTFSTDDPEELKKYVLGKLKDGLSVSVSNSTEFDWELDPSDVDLFVDDFDGFINESLKEANLGPYKYRYEVRYTTPEGRDVLLGANKSIDGACEILSRQGNSFLESPWESKKNKLNAAKSMRIIDSESGKDVTPDFIKEQRKAVMNKIQKGVYD